MCLLFIDNNSNIISFEIFKNINYNQVVLITLVRVVLFLYLKNMMDIFLRDLFVSQVLVIFV